MHLRAETVCTILVLVLVVTTSQQVSAQANAPVGAGQLLEQQRSLEQDPWVPPRVTPAGTPLIPGPVFVPTPESPELGGIQVVVRQFTLRGNAELSNADLQARLKPWLGRTLGLRDLREAASTLEQFYRDRGWLAQVSLPSQDVTEGNVVLTIVEAKRGRIRLTQSGTPRPGSAKAAERVQSLLESNLPEGQALNLKELDRTLRIASDMPGGATSGSLQAGATEGSTDVLILKVTDSLTRQIDVSADNAGNRSTGANRLNANITLNSPWGHGEQITLGASKTEGSEYLRASVSWPISFPGLTGGSQWNGWRMGVSASALRYRVLDGMNTSTGLSPQGNSQTVGADLQYPMVRSALSNWQLNLGLEEKRLRNQDDNVVLGQLEVSSAANTRALTIGLSGNQQDDWGRGANNLANVVLTLGRINLHGSPAPFIASDQQTANTQGSFQKLRYYLTRTQVLTNDATLHASVNGQWASRNLDSGEKMYLGGMSGVRAYPSGEVGGSSGQLFSLELRQQLNAQWQITAFYDYGQVDQYQKNDKADGSGPLVAHNGVALSGAGLSLGWRSNHGVQFKGTWAQRLGGNPLATLAGNDTDGSLRKNRFWLSTNAPF